MKAKISFLAVLAIFTIVFAHTPEEDFKDCLCQCRCINAMGFECYTSNQECMYDAQALLCGEERAAEDNAVCSCYSPELCYRVALEPSDTECYADCMKWYNQATNKPPQAACGDGICSASETAVSCPADCAQREEEIEDCDNGADDDRDELVDCFDTESCKCSQTVWLAVTYEGEDKKQRPAVGVNVTFSWLGAGYSQQEKSAVTDEEGRVNAKLDGVWEGDGEVSFEIIFADDKFKIIEGDDLYTISGDFVLENEKDLENEYELKGDDRITARIWERSHEAYNFYTHKLKTNVDYDMPEEIYVKGPGSASHGYSSLTRTSPYTIDKGIKYGSKVYERGFNNSASPQNCEWHEFNHHAMMAIYGGMWDQKAFRNHLGWGNPQSDDSYVEGFAEFMSLLETEAYKDKYPRLATRLSIYYWDDTASNLEKNYNIKDDEEFAVASILWDLYDPPSSSLVDKDHVQIDQETLWRVLSTQHRFSDGQMRYIHNTRDLYEAVKALGEPEFNLKLTDYFEPKDDGWMDDAPALEKIFIAHGAFWDKNNNSKWDAGEEVGYTSKKDSPATRRTDKELPPGAFLRANINGGGIQSGTVKVKVMHPGEYNYLDYEYESSFRDGLIGIEPPYDTPTTWEITVTSEGYTESRPAIITSEEYNERYDPEKNYFDTRDFEIAPLGGTTGFEEWDAEAPCCPLLLIMLMGVCCAGIMTATRN